MPKTYIVVNAVRREDVPASGAYLYPNIPLPVWDLWIGAAEVMVAGERIALPNERPPTEAAFYLNRFFGVAFAGRFAASEISVRTSCASFASLCPLRRAIFVRISSAFFSISTKIAGRSGSARRSLFILAVCRED